MSTDIDGPAPPMSADRPEEPEPTDFSDIESDASPVQLRRELRRRVQSASDDARLPPTGGRHARREGDTKPLPADYVPKHAVRTPGPGSVTRPQPVITSRPRTRPRPIVPAPSLDWPAPDGSVVAPPHTPGRVAPPPPVPNGPAPPFAAPRPPGPKSPGPKSHPSGTGRQAAAQQAAAQPAPVVEEPDPAPVEVPSKRVRVVLAERKGAPRVVRTMTEVRELTQVGELMSTTLIRSQLALALRIGGIALIVLGVLPAMFAVFPEIGEVEILHIRLPWLMLGVLAYPFLLALGWLHARTADRLEQVFADHVQD